MLFIIFACTQFYFNVVLNLVMVLLVVGLICQILFRTVKLASFLNKIDVIKSLSLIFNDFIEGNYLTSILNSFKLHRMQW